MTLARTSWLGLEDQENHQISFKSQKKERKKEYNARGDDYHLT